MKLRVLIIALLCMFLCACASPVDRQEQTEASIQVETTQEATTPEETAVIHPLPDTTMETLENSIVNISFEEGGFYRDESGRVFLRMKIYSYDKFDMVDISGLKPGNAVILSSEKLTVRSVDRNDYGTVLVNGGLDEGGFDLATDDSGIYYAHGYSDMKSWNLVGEAEYPVSEEFVFTDSADPELGEMNYTAANLADSIPAPAFGYQPQNTMVRIENGWVVAMNRIYTP